ncbi:glycosyltransferase family 4 protein [Pseudoxanthomonas kalamensis]|uniref:glycosyltransferase family 4 protein n=1 Tax=Pseudoxanthomonas kalamensis TaxID=289483 RepID=UPI0013918FA9|nr:glycosyltransferase family 4 protein [Pseudoxanthomonas kalamensis]
MEAAYPADRGGGAEAQVRTLTRGLRARGHRVTILAPCVRWGAQEKVSRYEGAAVCRLRLPGLPLLGGPVLWLRTTAFLYSRRKRYDAWHVHIAHRMAAICALMGRWLDKRVLTKVSGWWELEKGTLAKRPGPVNALARTALRRTETWQAISRRIALTLIERGIPAEHIVALPNAVDTSRFSSITRASDAPPRFVFIGRLVPEKGLQMLLSAFADIAPTHPQASLLVVGSGTLENHLKQEAQHLGISNQVEFAGHRDDIENVLADGNIGVLCSRIEGLSNTLLESMASGLPMIASRISGNEDFVLPGENGWLFDSGDRTGLAKCLADAAATDPATRAAMGEAARASVQRQAGLEQVLNRLVQLYRGKQPRAMPASVSQRSA